MMGLLKCAGPIVLVWIASMLAILWIGYNIEKRNPRD